MKNISFIIPCYNENPEVIYATIDNLNQTLVKQDELEFEIIIIDDGSTKYKYDFSFFKEVRSIKHHHNKGYSSSIITGIMASAHNFIGIVDSDATYPVEEFPKLIEYVGEFDQVIGERSWAEIEKIRVPAKFLLTKFACFMAGKEIKDLNSGMRIFRKDIALRFKRFFPKKFSITSTLTMAFLTHEYEVKFVPISYSKRSGSSHIHPIKDTIRFFSLVLRLSLYFNPLRFFVPLCSLLMLIATARATRDIISTNAIGNFAILIFFMAFQVFLIGLLAEIINKK